MAKSRKNRGKNKGKNKNVKTVCKTVCGKTRKILGKFVRNKRYLNKMQKKCTKSCVNNYTRKRRRNQKGGATTGVLPTIFTNLIDSVSHSAVSTIDVFNGYPVGDSPLPFLAHYKPLL